MGYLLLTLAIVLEVLGTAAMKLSDGFTKVVPSVLLFIFYAVSFVAFTYALKYIDVSIAYAIWAGLGVLLIAVIGVLYFDETITALKIVSIALIILGVVGLSITEVHE